MNPLVETKSTSVEAEDPFRYGWRYVRHEGPDGSVDFKQVPLTAEDVLHPQEEDFIVENLAHIQDCTTIYNALLAQIAKRPSWHVLKNHRVDFGVPGIEPFGPDFVVFEGGTLPEDPQAGTFYVKEAGAKTALVIEVTSPTTRNNDLDIKVSAYEQCGVPFYVIVDRPLTETDNEARLLAYRVTLRGYVQIYPDDRGWLWLEPLRMWLAVEENRAVCYDENEKQFETYPVEREARKIAEERAEAAEKRNRELEDELRRLQDKK